MLAYPIPEAEELLKSKLETAKKSLANCEEDMEFLREQVTVCHTPSSWKDFADRSVDTRGRVRARVQLGRRSAQKGKGSG
jgi:hypothetical protein